MPCCSLFADGRHLLLYSCCCCLAFVFESVCWHSICASMDKAESAAAAVVLAWQLLQKFQLCSCLANC